MAAQQATYQKYTAQFTVDLDSDVIHGRVLEINDVLTFEGRTVEDAKKEFHKAIDDYLDFCRRKGIEPEKPFSGKFLFRTKTPDDHRRIYLAATKTGKTINAWMQDVSNQAADRDLSDRSLLPDQEFVNPTSPEDAVDAIYDDSFFNKVYEKLSPLLVSAGPLTTVQFVKAVHTIQSGLKMMKSCLKNSQLSNLLSVVEVIEKEVTQDSVSRSPHPKRH